MLMHLLQHDFRPSDNYFDLAAGGSHKIEITPAESFTIAELTLGHWSTQWH
jgi:hypothetical protein